MAASIGPGPGVIGQILYSLGYVPKVSASVQSLKNQLNQIGQQITSLQAQDATVQQAITSAKAAITGLTAHFQALTDEITADVNDISALSASIADLKSQLASDSTTITSLTGELSGAVASLNGLTQLNASPSWVSQGNGLASEDVTGGTIDFDGVTQTVTQGLDGGISAFIDPGAVEAVFSFSPGFSGLSAPSSSPATQAQGLGGIGGNLATLLGYIPISQATSDAPQVAELKSLIITATAQLQNVQTLLANDQSTLSGLTTQKNSLQGQVNSAQLNFSSYQSHIASLNATIASDTSQHGSNLSTISGLTTNLDSVNSVLSHAQVGTLPVSVSWTFGDGSPASTENSPSYGWSQLPTIYNSTYNNYNNPASVTYQPAVTINVNVPATPVTTARTVTRTFKTRPIILAIWPHQVNSNDPCGSFCTGGSNYTLQLWVVDRNGIGIPNTRVFLHANEDYFFNNTVLFLTTDNTGYCSVQFNAPIVVGGVHIAYRSVRDVLANGVYNKTSIF